MHLQVQIANLTAHHTFQLKLSATMDNPNPTQTGTDPKVVAIVSYITLIGLIIAIVLNNPKSDLGSFHIRQALGITLLAIVGSFLNIIPILGQILYIVIILGTLVLWVIGLVSAVQGEKKPVPVLGEKFQEWFRSL